MPLAGYYRNELERVDKGSKRLREVMDVLSRQQLREAIERAASGEASRFDLMCQSLDGRLLTLDFSLNPIFDAKKMSPTLCHRRMM